ncbi:MAG: ABC transporter permease subunit [Chloroflexi bacterium]|nr:ABC transporter permease subunit [Chloroflexota bacterium]
MRHSVLGKTLREQRRALLAWMIGLSAVAVLYASFYPAMSSPDLTEAMDSFAPEFMEALGFTALGTPAGYLGSTTFGIPGPVLTILLAAWLGIRAIAGEEEGGRLDLLLAQPVSRWRVALERFGALVVVMAVLAVVLFVALLSISGPADLGAIGPGNLAAGTIHLAVLGVWFGGLALGVGAATGSRAITTGVVAIVGVGGYFANTLAAPIDAIGWMRDISPFHYYSGGRPLVHGLQVADVAVLLLSASLIVVLGTVRLDRRDVGT